MIVRIDRFLKVGLEQPEEFKKFSVQVEGDQADLERIRPAVRTAGDLVDSAVMWVSEDWLRQAPGCAGDPGWQQGVSKMIEFARKHGWVREPSGEIRAHVVWVPVT
ncbi:hypothetical protein [Roseomonas chloroacetimidivorans]|uniref:hypothetical protein n=1 Tax=Roseomonas chloroacetimidivorans TaxID=1766656 RepID=UPI003C783E39